MKIYRLAEYDYSDTSEYGTFSEQGKAAMEARFLADAKVKIAENIERIKVRIDEERMKARKNQMIADDLYQKMKEIGKENYSAYREIRQQRNPYLKTLERINGDIHRLRITQTELESLDDKQLVKKYMLDNHLEFYESTLNDIESPISSKTFPWENPPLELDNED